ncbi:hypothetical protein ACHAXN_012270 [Cyclotella atomus]
MASANSPSPSRLANSFASSATKMASQPFVAQLTSEQNPPKESTKRQRVLLRVKRLRQAPTNPFAVASSSFETTANADDAANSYFEPDTQEGQGVPVKKRRLSSTTAPEIIRLSLPTSNKRPKSKKEENELISRLSSAVGLYGSDETNTTVAPGTPTRHSTEEDALPSSKTPVKPKRSVIFRKLTDLRKLLHQDDDDDNNSNNEHNEGSWDSKGEERSKWLRVVDVKLQESESPHEAEGTGPRLQRLRCRPTQREEEDANEDPPYGKSSKRRKLVVEKSCTMSQSEFWNDTTASTSTAAAASNTMDQYKSIKLEKETVQLVQYSLQTLHNQKGGTVSPFLSSLKLDSRLNFQQGTARSNSMINHKLTAGNGRTVLHYAALWGDVNGIRDAIEMGANPTMVDALGHTPSALAELNGHQEALLALLEAEAATTTNKPGDYYYEVYCLEGEQESVEISGTSREVKVPVNRNNGSASPNEYSSFTTSESSGSPPELIRMDGHGMSEDEDSCVVALMELQNGFGYWNERGELVLEAVDRNMPNRNSATSSVAYAEDSSGEDASIDYPDEESDEEVRDNYAGDHLDALGSDYDDYFDADARDMSAYSSDDDSEAGWRLDFRNRSVPGNGAGDREEESEGELSSGGFGTDRNGLHGWTYSRGMVDGESDDEEYAGPMLG